MMLKEVFLEGANPRKDKPNKWIVPYMTFGHNEPKIPNELHLQGDEEVVR